MARHYSSADPAIAPDLAKIATAPEWLPKAQVPANTAGLHRLTWDARHDAPPALHDAEHGGGGVFAPPGRYRVRLTVDGKSFEAPLTLLPDPRVSASPAAYAAQFQLARAIEADRVRVAGAIKAAPDPDKPPPALAAVAERLQGTRHRRRWRRWRAHTRRPRRLRQGARGGGGVAHQMTGMDGREGRPSSFSPRGLAKRRH